MTFDACVGDPDELSAPRLADPETFVFPVSCAQQRLWIVDQLDPARPTYNIPINVRIAGKLDVDALQASFTHVVARHEALRTVFATEDGRPVQVVLPPEPVTIPVVDLNGLPAEDCAAETARLVHASGSEPFDLHTGPLVRAILFRTDVDEHVLALTIHHIAFDGWSLGILEREIASAYDAFANGATLSLPALAIQYADFAVWQRDQMNGTAHRDQVAYWTEALRRPLPLLDLFSNRQRGNAGKHIAGSVRLEIPTGTVKAVRALARSTRTTPFTVLLATFQVLLKRYTGQDDIIVGTPVTGRADPATEELIGCFVNMLPLRTSLAGDPDFQDLIDRTGATVRGALANGDVPFDKLVEIVHPERTAGRNPVFQAVFSLDTMEADGTLTLPGLVTTKLAGAHDIAKFDVQLILRTTPDGFHGALEYDTDLYEADSMERLMRNFEHLLRDALNSPDRAIGQLQLLDPEEYDLVTRAWNQTARQYPRDSTVAELFERCAAATPDAIAVEFEGSSLSYSELDGRANQLARRLQDLGVTRDVTVGLCVSRSLEMVVAALGILKAGGAYVPLDSALPRARLEFMVRDTATRIVIAQEQVADAVANLGATVVLIDTGWETIALESSDALDCPATADSLAYVMYTSGSTGSPKGVAVVHRGVVRLVSNTDYAHLGPQEVSLCFAPLAFDASTFEIWGALLNGGRLVVFPGHVPGVEELGEFIERNGITTLWLTAALFRQIVDRALPGLRRIRQLLAGGDVLSPFHVRRVMREIPGCQVVNGYGPTENTTFTCCYTIPFNWSVEDSSAATVPIGRPISNTTAYVLDPQLNPVPIGVAGRLHAGGDGVARGYLNKLELTAERFIPDRFDGRPTARLYDTGDLARWRPDGNLEFLGRLDNQVKLRGYRIELGEIETTLLEHTDVQDASVMLRHDDDSVEPVLVAYYVPVPSARVHDEMPEAGLPMQLRAYLRARLPDYMIPSVFVALQALPLGSNGKLDRLALPAPESIRTPGSNGHAAPRTGIELELVRIWESLLPQRPIGIHDDFFDIGGHSLLAIQMLSRIKDSFGARLPMATLFDTSTISDLGLLLESSAKDPDEPSVVVLHASAQGDPFAFVHGDLRGAGWYCRQLASLLGADFPFFLFHNIDSDSPSSPASIEGMAAVNVAELRRIQPRGPYRLGGFCAGGLVAFEMARQLIVSGESIDRLILIETSARNVRFRWLDGMMRTMLRGSGEAETVSRRARLLRRLDYYVGRAQEVRRMSWREQLGWLSTNIARHASGAGSVGSLPKAGPGKPDPSADEFESRRGTKAVQFHARAASAFVHRAYQGEIDVIIGIDGSAASSGRSVRDTVRDWRRVTRALRVHTVDSSHLGLITSDLPALAETVRQCLDGNEEPAT